MEATVIGIEYDPTEVQYCFKFNMRWRKSLYLAPVGLKDGDKVISGDKADIKPGNCMKIEIFQ